VNVGDCEPHVVGRNVCSVDCSRKHPPDDAFGTFDVGRLAGDQQAVAICVERNFKGGFDSGEVAIVLPEQTDAIRQALEFDRSLRGQRAGYSLRSARGFPMTSETMTASASLRRLPSKAWNANVRRGG
jgi:hypothetical protein